MAENNTGDWR